MVNVKMDAYQNACESYLGWCTNCNTFIREGTEPDAMDYDCPECKKNTVVGAESSLLCGYIEVISD